MADKIYLSGTFAYREDTLENWQNANPVLEKGEPAIVRDGADGEWLKIGDGVTAWNDLPYKKGPRGDRGADGARGPQGEAGEDGKNGVDGKDYALTEADKQEIADMAKPEIDQTFDPTSEKPQSGIAVAEAVGGWKKIVNITTTEEISGLIPTVEEFPQMAKSKEFFLRVQIPKVATTTSLGTFVFSLSAEANWKATIYRCQVTAETNAIKEIRAHGYIIDDILHGIGCSAGTGSVVTTANMLCSPSYSKDVNGATCTLLSGNLFPIGTQFTLYGKVGALK